jgi:transposase
MEEFTAFVGLDVHKDSIVPAVAEGGRGGRVEVLGRIPMEARALRRLVERLARRYRHLEFCYEAGPCGYGVYRLLEAWGHRCVVAAPSKLSRAPGDRVKNDKSDARLLAVSLRAGLVVPVWVPDERHEAVRGLTRGRRAAVKARKSERQRLNSLLLVHGRCYAGKSRWTRSHWAWLADQRFGDPALQLVKQDAIEAIRYNEERVKLLTASMLATATDWHLAPVVAALQALYGINAVAAVILMAEIGDPRRFASASALVAYLGMRPSEESSGDRLRRGSITKAGNAEARRVLIEAAWCYRLPPQVSKAIEARRDSLPAALRAKVWKTHNRLYRRYWHLRKVGNKRSTVAVTAVARELTGAVWAIACWAMDPSRGLEAEEWLDAAGREIVPPGIADELAALGPAPTPDEVAAETVDPEPLDPEVFEPTGFETETETEIGDPTAAAD